MNKTARILKLLQILRSYKYPVTADRIAEQLGISVRTVYRDIATLQAQGAEIDGQAGIGYILKPSFFLPPLMLTPIEIDSLLLGMRWVIQYGDLPLAAGAQEALTKITDVLPHSVQKNMNAYALRVGPPPKKELMQENLSSLREAIAQQNKIEIQNLILWPFTIGYFTDCRVLVAWCENEKKYKHIKTASIAHFKVLAERYPTPKKVLFIEWQKLQLKDISS